MERGSDGGSDSSYASSVVQRYVVMHANYYGSPPNSSWLTHVATSPVTLAPPPQDLEDRRLVFTQVPWETPIVRRIVVAVLLIAWLRASAVANPAGPGLPGAPPHDPDAADRASETDAPAASPWLDQSPAPVLETREVPRRRDRRLAAALTLGGLYAGFTTWTYFAWYRTEGHPFAWADASKDGSWKIWSNDGWFGTHRYAGGADKLGHAWATMSLARAGTELLHQWGGYDKLTASIVGTVLSEALFFGVELKDGFAYTFSFGDFWFNTGGALLAFAQSNVPRLDELIDFRVEYFPSKHYRKRFHANRDIDWAEDYSGQTYLLALHLGAFHRLRDWKWGSWSRFVDVAVGYETRGYKPDPLCKVDGVTCLDYDKHQSLFLGVSLNAQGLFDYLLRGRADRLRKVTHGMFEVFNLPFTSAPLLDYTRVPVGDVPNDGA